MKAQVSADDDIRGDPVATTAAGTRDGMGTTVSLLRLRSSLDTSVGKGWCPFRDGHDRTPGRERRASKHDFGGARQWRRTKQRVFYHRSQMVLLSADV